MSTYDNNSSYRPLNSNSNNGNFAASLCNWLKHIKVYKIVCLILVLLFVIPILAHYYILNVSKPFECNVVRNINFPKSITFLCLQVEPEVNEAEIHHSRSQLDVYEDISNLRASDLKLRIEEMLRIKVSFTFDFVTTQTDYNFHSQIEMKSKFLSAEHRFIGIA